MRKFGTIIVLFLMTCGCQMAGSDKESFGVLDTGEEITYKVLFWSRVAFDSNYKEHILSAYPNVQLELIATDTGLNVEAADYIQLIRETNPDIVWVSGKLLPKLAEEGILQSLDAYIQEDDFDIENIHAPVIDYIRDLGGGSIYALAPNFRHNVLFYNKTLFEQHGVPLPHDYMNWDDVIALARQFPTDGPEIQRVYGFLQESWPPKYGLRHFILHELGRTYELEWLDSENRRLTLNTDAWKPIFEMGLQFVNSETMAIEGADDMFTHGRAAMMLDGYAWISYQFLMAQMAQRDMPFEWGIVTAPINPEQPEYTHHFSLDFMFAVNANASNPQAAWDIVKFINSDTFAALTPPTMLFATTRPDRIERIDGVTMDTFYKLKPGQNAFSKPIILPESFQEAFTDIFNEEMERVMNNEKSLEQALADLEARGQAELDLALADEQD